MSKQGHAALQRVDQVNAPIAGKTVSARCTPCTEACRVHVCKSGQSCRAYAASRAARSDEAPAQNRCQDGAVDIEEFAHNLARMIEEGGKALAAYLKPREEGRSRRRTTPTRSIDVVKTLGQVAEYWLTDPQRARRAADQAGPGLSRSVGDRGQAHGRRRGPAGRRARSARQALRRSGMVDEPVLRLPQAGLSADRATGRTIWSSDAEASIRTPGRRPSSTCARSSMRSRRRISC